MRLPHDRILHIDTELAGDEVRVVAEWQGEIVRCKDCRHQPYCMEERLKEFWAKPIEWCSRGERREE